MGRRHQVVSTIENPQQSQNAMPTTEHNNRKRKRKVDNSEKSTYSISSKTLRMNASNNYWHENDDEDSSSNDATRPARNQSNKHANNSSILLNSSIANRSIPESVNITQSPKPVYTLHPSVVNGTILYDLKRKPWRLGKPIGKGNFGEIFLASHDISMPATNENSNYVVKIEPHSNGPLFVEIHCLINTAEKKNYENLNDDKNKFKDTIPISLPPKGIPDYIASGSHYFGNARYRFLVLERFDHDLHSLIKNCRVHQKYVLILGMQIVRVLENLHNKGYCHNDIKAQNLMISKCKYFRGYDKKEQPNVIKSKTKANFKNKFDEHYDEKQQTTDSGNSSEQEPNEDDHVVYNLMKRRHQPSSTSSISNDYYDADEDEDFDDGITSHSNNSNSMDIYKTPRKKNNARRVKTIVEYSGSNPVRSCRNQKRNLIYEEMVTSHYLRPTKRINYAEFFNEDGSLNEAPTKIKEENSSEEDSDEFVPENIKRSLCSSTKNKDQAQFSTKRITRREESRLKMSKLSNNINRTTIRKTEEECIFLIDFGLASKYIDNDVHRPFVMDQRRAHDGTLEFTSRDAHMGAHSRRSDLECLGYNLLFWSEGYLPWKDAASQQQQEKVHRAKEYLMTDVKEILKHIYGKDVPKYLGEFLYFIGKLAYHDRPDYEKYHRIFQRAYEHLGFSSADMHLDSRKLQETCLRILPEMETWNDIFDANKHNLNNNNNSINSGNIVKKYLISGVNITPSGILGAPYEDHSLANRVSPKNLRSKSEKKGAKKKFSWAQVLSQDPDQIARERAEKEFDREEYLSNEQQEKVRRYEGKPTYAILNILRLMKRDEDKSISLIPTNPTKLNKIKKEEIQKCNRELKSEVFETDGDYVDNDMEEEDYEQNEQQQDDDDNEEEENSDDERQAYAISETSEGEDYEGYEDGCSDDEHDGFTDDYNEYSNEINMAKEHSHPPLDIKQTKRRNNVYITTTKTKQNQSAEDNFPVTRRTAKSTKLYETEPTSRRKSKYRTITQEFSKTKSKPKRSGKKKVMPASATGEVEHFYTRQKEYSINSNDYGRLRRGIIKTEAVNVGIDEDSIGSCSNSNDIYPNDFTQVQSLYKVLKTLKKQTYYKENIVKNVTSNIITRRCRK